jgi:plastocyanin
VRRRLLRAALLGCLLALATSAPAAAQNVQLRGTVGPDFEIRLTNASGARVTQLDPGTYDITVEDRSDQHNFHLCAARNVATSWSCAPGVNERTGVETLGTVTWTVTFVEGRYIFVCDPHVTMPSMRSAFIVGNPPAPSPPPPRVRRLQALVGPGYTISTRTMAGARIRTYTGGRVDLIVRDRSRIHNFHLIGPGVNRRTGVAFRGTRTWRLTLRRGTYRFLCDPHARDPRMRGSFRVR